jgi:hypothetical protein
VIFVFDYRHNLLLIFKSAEHFSRLLRAVFHRADTPVFFFQNAGKNRHGAGLVWYFYRAEFCGFVKNIRVLLLPDKPAQFYHKLTVYVDEECEKRRIAKGSAYAVDAQVAVFGGNFDDKLRKPLELWAGRDVKQL